MMRFGVQTKSGARDQRRTNQTQPYAQEGSTGSSDFTIFTGTEGRLKV